MTPTNSEQRSRLKVLEQEMMNQGVPFDLVDRCVTTARADTFIFDMLELWMSGSYSERLDLQDELSNLLR